ncbi:hypothetical protein [Pseudogemmobacter bohemicus]|uniref:hypothetical protein n=1 Tax=Pseudogemmobacter bohemicus TaxID=2250708 RepID=UPI0013001FA5|nr:hypothetical protein [Pseudogemmobacter bohemicus]
MSPNPWYDVSGAGNAMIATAPETGFYLLRGDYISGGSGNARLTVVAPSFGGTFLTTVGQVTQNIVQANSGTLIRINSTASASLRVGVSLRRQPGHHALQPTAANRPRLQQSGSQWYLLNDGNDSLPVTLPGGTYGLALADRLAGISVTTISNPANVLQSTQQLDILLRATPFTPGETAKITSYWTARYS